MSQKLRAKCVLQGVASQSFVGEFALHVLDKCRGDDERADETRE